MIESEPPERDPGVSADDPVFESFLRNESAALVGYLRSRRLDPEDARDIAQEAQMRLLRYRGQDAEILRPLLYRIASNLLRDRWRQQSTQRVTWIGQSTDAETVATEDPGPDQLAAQQQELARAKSAIAALPAHCRGVYLLNRIEGMSYTQIARHMGVSVKAVEKQISKALALLRQAMDSPGGS
ncbi:RNA polymerase sigma factor [Luteimonas abyssi]|uniref:RNA polymerase sigma factor n=1 Tax=Luteimonas abyssi TaxID=1247514 RepID=UPI000737D00F|nr:RNA polymerase sigma factor [Luteimonas abyssi]